MGKFCELIFFITLHLENICIIWIIQFYIFFIWILLLSAFHFSIWKLWVINVYNCDGIHISLSNVTFLGHLFLCFIQVSGPATIISFQRFNFYLYIYILISCFILLMKYLLPRDGIDDALVGDGDLIYSWR